MSSRLVLEDRSTVLRDGEFVTVLNPAQDITFSGTLIDLATFQRTIAAAARYDEELKLASQCDRKYMPTVLA